MFRTFLVIMAGLAMYDLYRSYGTTILVLTLVGLFLAWVTIKAGLRKLIQPKAKQTQPTEVHITIELPANDDESDDFDWDEARRSLQKLSYSMADKTVSKADKDAFKAFMTRFAAADPLYHDVMILVKRLLRNEPGVVQSELYKGEPESRKEMIRYVLYFAQELGDIHREKHGRSYKLYLPNALEGEVVG